MIYNATTTTVEPKKSDQPATPMRKHSWWWHHSWALKVIIGGIFLIVAVIGGGYVMGILQFQENHYNARMVINGVNVGRMTVTQASQAIQEQGITGYVIDQGHLRAKHTPNQSVISQKKLKYLLKQQYSIWPGQVQNVGVN